MKLGSQIIFSLVLITAFPSAEYACGQPSKAAQIDALIAPVVATRQFSGIVLAMNDGKVIYEKAFGMANAEQKVPNARNSRFGIASITKPMTSIVLIRLIEEKKLDLEDKLSKFIPDFPNGDKITIAMLSEHRSGIPHRVMPPEQETQAYTGTEMVQKARAATLAFEPGSQRLYSSAGYSVLARVLEIAGDQTYDRLLKKYIFDVAGMADSVDWDWSTIIDRRVNDYLRDERGYVNAPYKDYSFLIGAGSVLSTGSDLNKFAMAILDGKFGASARISLVTEGVFTASGTTNGRRAYLEFKENKSYGLVILSNMSSGSFDFVQKGVTEILHGKSPSIKTLSIPYFDPTANRDLVEFAGTYQRSDGGAFVIELRKGNLFSSDIKLHSVKKDCFFDFRFYGDICFSRDASGKVSGIRWRGLTFDLTGTK
jgi:CubicO group peptidase (beta-lactamase class C family)